MKKIRDYGVIVMLLVVLVGTLINTHRANKTYDELFEAFIDARTLINKQTEYINELTEYMKQVKQEKKNNS